MRSVVEAEALGRGLTQVDTLECLTGRVAGGRHLYFYRPAFRVGNKSLAPNLDTRCDNGYAILPPSVHPTGRPYRWRGRLTDVRELP